jgi:hypothetical protein
MIALAPVDRIKRTCVRSCASPPPKIAGSDGWKAEAETCPTVREARRSIADLHSSTLQLQAPDFRP